MTEITEFPERAFAKADSSPDPLFYAAPRFVTHIDDRAIRAVTELYRALLPPGERVLDLMSSGSATCRRTLPMPRWWDTA